MVFWVLGTTSTNVKKPIKHQEQKIKISLKELPITSKKSGLTKKVPKVQKKIPPMPKGSQLKKIVKPSKKTKKRVVKKITKQKKVKYTPKKVEKKRVFKKITINKTKKVEPKIKQILKTKPIPPKKLYIPLKKEKQKKKKIDKAKQNDPLAWMNEDKSDEEVKVVKRKKVDSSSINQDIKELYGEEFGKLTLGQQKYIIDNQEIMRRITQQVLTRVARVNLPRDLNVNRVNIIEFYLHPNGDMTDFKFLKKSGYYVLDDTTKETIEYAYSKYPRPSEKTLIRYNVFYNLARY